MQMKQSQDIATLARTLVRSVDVGVLSTQSHEHEGYPFGSVTPYVLMPNGNLVVYLSSIAQHTHNIEFDPKVCLTILERAKDSQASGRVSFLGDARAVSEDRVAEVSRRYFSFFESARGYVETHDFSFTEIEFLRVRFIGGFGKIHWIEKEDWMEVVPQWQDDEASIIAHMNDDHSDSLCAMCRSFVADDCESAEMLSLDPNGFHVRTPSDIHYLSFATACFTSRAVREEMIRLSRLATP
jgi:putative heme iron utilization protein